MKRFLIALVAIAGMSATVAGMVFLVRQHRQGTIISQFAAAGPATLAREEALDRQAGMALGPAQMQQPLPPPSQNAAPLYSKLTTLLHDKPLGLPPYAEGMDAFHSYTPAQIAAVRQTLAARQDVMTLVHEAADKPQCVYVRDWGSGADVTFPEYQPMREAVRLLKTESYLLARDGKYHEAIINQERGFHVAKHAASDPILLPYLVGIACDLLTLSGMQSILALAGPNHAVATEIQNSVAANRPKLSLRRAMAGETGFGFVCLSRMHQAEGRGVSAALAAGGFGAGDTQKAMASAAEKQNLHNLIDAWQADYLAHMRPLVLAGDLTPAARWAAFAAARETRNQEEKGVSAPTHLVSLMLLPVFDRIDENATRCQTREVATLAAAAVLTAKTERGVFPSALPPQFVDPFTGKPLGYRREGRNGFIIYSAGLSGTYAGSEPGTKIPPGESEFRYPPVPLPIPANMLK